MKRLLQAGVDAEGLGWTALMQAIVLGTIDDVRIALERDENLEVRDRWSRTPWLLTAWVRDIEKAEVVRSAGGRIEDRGKGEETALMICAERGHDRMLGWLITLGADLEAIDDSRNTALILAAQSGEASCVCQLLAAGANAASRDEHDANAMALAESE